MLEQVSKMAVSHIPGGTTKYWKIQSVYVKRIRKTSDKFYYMHNLLNTLKFRCLYSEKSIAETHSSFTHKAYNKQQSKFAWGTSFVIKFVFMISQS